MIKKIKDKIPIIFCSAKTKKEQKFFLKKFEINHPFIVEDGSAICIPKNYFKEKVGEIRNDYEVIVLGVNVNEIFREIKNLKKRFKIKSFSDLTSEEISKITGLDLKLARLAKEREFSETIVEWDEEVVRILRKKYNVILGGKFLHVFGKNADKGKAVRILKKLYERNFKEKIISIGLGNSYTDEPMLKEVDIPVLIRNPDGKWADLNIKNVYKTEKTGPSGWVEAVKKFLGV